MCARLGLGIDCGVAAVVAGRTLTGKASMSHGRGGKGDGIFVAGVTLLSRRNVVARLGQPLWAATGHVAGGATSSDGRHCRCVVKGGRGPGGGAVVAGITLGGSDLVICTLGLGILRNVPAAMAGYALTVKSGVIHRRGNEGVEIQMAGTALGGGGNMVGRLG